MLIVITLPTFFDDEASLVNQLFEAGLTTLHLRKPQATQAQLEVFLRSINPLYLKRVVLHSHYALMNQYNIKGIHLTSRVWQELLEQNSLKTFIRPLQKRGLSVSASTHSLAEVQQMPSTMDYVFLSPFFDSISKANYGANVDFDAVKQWLIHATGKPAVVALGGVEINKRAILKDIGIQHLALLGTIWQAENPINALKEWL